MGVIKSISFDNAEILKSILQLHVPGGEIQCDPTYSKGNLYKQTGIAPPQLKFDISPQTEDTEKCDCRELPLSDGAVECIMFDPPFVCTHGPSVKEKRAGTNLIINRFSCFPTAKELYAFYAQALEEFYRVLSKKGILIFKCQDQVSSGIQYMSHIYIHNMAVEKGFYP